MPQTATHVYEPKNGHRLPHDPFNAIVAPRPIGWISTQDAQGVLNLAAYSFFNSFNFKPPIVGFSSLGNKDSVRNARETGEFGWSLSTRPLAEAMNATCATVGPEVDEFQLAGLTPEPSRCIAVPRVAESPVSFECKVTQILQLTTASGEELPTWVVFGEVVAVHIAEHLLVDGIYQTIAAQPISRGGGPADYFDVRPENLFRMRQPA
ncbi:flavin reductase family protein [Xanthomonas axonopodis]|uniref:flavin reductase family protein n=1 Tax=Xanthomonas axonopodis TaxID=53413 RepID=UPI003557CA01